VSREPTSTKIKKDVGLRILDAFAFGTVAAKCAHSSRSSKNFSTMRYSASDEIFLTRSYCYAFLTCIWSTGPGSAFEVNEHFASSGVSVRL